MAQKTARLRFLFDGAGTRYIDLWRCLSIAQRKMFRQGQVCHVMGGLIKDSNNETTISINTAPDTWVTRTAWRRAKRLYDKHIEEGLEGVQGNVKPKYHDFKVYLNNVMGSGTVPVDAGGDTIPFQEWVYSSYHSEDVDWADPNLLASSNRQADTFQVMLTGDHVGTPQNWTRISAIKSWFDSRAEPDIDEPNMPTGFSTDPLVNLFDEADATDEVLASLDTDNDRPPYDEDSHWGYDVGQPVGPHYNLQRQAFAATQSGAGSISPLNGFSAICGLLEVQVTQGSGSGLVEMLIDVALKGDKI